MIAAEYSQRADKLCATGSWWHRHSCLCLYDTARSGCVTASGG